MSSASVRILVVFLAWVLHAQAEGINLGTASNFAVLGGSSINNNGVTTICGGDVGSWPGTSNTGLGGIALPCGDLFRTGGLTSQQGQSDLSDAYNFAVEQLCGVNLTGLNLGGLVLFPGTFCFAGPAQLTGTLTLDAQGDPDAVFLFQIQSALTTASSSVVKVINGGTGEDVFWQVGTSADLGINSVFKGNVLALLNITVNAGTSIPCGRLLGGGGIALNTTTVSIQ